MREAVSLSDIHAINIILVDIMRLPGPMAI